MAKAHEEQQNSTRAAHQLIGKLPPGYRWSLTITDEDDHQSPSVLNIYVPEPDWRYVANRLQLTMVPSRADDSMSWRVAPALLLSLIDEEKS